jgi:hypothetical protein
MKKLWTKLLLDNPTEFRTNASRRVSMKKNIKLDFFLQHHFISELLLAKEKETIAESRELCGTVIMVTCTR